MSINEEILKSHLESSEGLKKSFEEFVLSISPYVKVASEGFQIWGEGVEKATNGVNNLAQGVANGLTSANDYLNREGFEEWAILFSAFKYGIKYAIWTNPSLLIGQGLMSAIGGQDPEKIANFILETPENLGKFFEITEKVVESLKEKFETNEKNETSQKLEHKTEGKHKHVGFNKKARDKYLTHLEKEHDHHHNKSHHKKLSLQR